MLYSNNTTTCQILNNDGWTPSITSNAIGKCGDILQIAIPAMGLLSTIYHKDKKGFLTWLACTLSTSGLSHLTKYVFSHTPLDIRPNGKHGSFPSAHTSSAFSGASFFSRYHEYQGIGMGVAITLYALACFTAYSRVETNNHHIHDAMVGAIIAEVASYLIFKGRDYISDIITRRDVTRAESNEQELLALRDSGSSESSMPENVEAERLPHSSSPNTFHGRDICAVTGAKS